MHGRTPPPPRAGAAEVAPGVQIALRTSPQRPRTQPPPGGPSGKLERDSVCQPPGAAPAGARAERSHKPPSPALPEQTRRGGGLGPPQNRGLRTAPAAQGKAEVKRLARRIPVQLSPNTKMRLEDHPGSRGQSRARLPALQTPVSVEGGRWGSFRISPYRTPQICCCLLAAHGTSPTPRTPSERGGGAILLPHWVLQLF